FTVRDWWWKSSRPARGVRKGLSRMRGNSHVRFLGEGAAATPLSYPTRRWRRCSMETAVPPRNYPEWRTGQFDRPEDAAYLFGYYLIMHCRDEAMVTLPAGVSPDVKAAVEKAVDTALHNVCDMLEGFWPLDAGPEHKISLALG